VTAAAISDAVRRGRYTYAQETELHLGLEAAMRAAGFEPVPEVKLNGRDRIDFLIGRVGIEVKIKGTRDALHRQVMRYAESPLVDELLVITTVRAHRGLPAEIGGKPLSLLVIGGIA
jgi:hypothetical protein